MNSHISITFTNLTVFPAIYTIDMILVLSMIIQFSILSGTKDGHGYSILVVATSPNHKRRYH